MKRSITQTLIDLFKVKPDPNTEKIDTEIPCPHQRDCTCSGNKTCDGKLWLFGTKKRVSVGNKKNACRPGKRVPETLRKKIEGEHSGTAFSWRMS